jgi:hypothetical protein
MIKDICLGQFWTFLVTKFQNHGSEMITMDFNYGLKMQLCIKWTQTKKFNRL